MLSRLLSYWLLAPFACAVIIAAGIGLATAAPVHSVFPRPAADATPRVCTNAKADSIVCGAILKYVSETHALGVAVAVYDPAYYGTAGKVYTYGVGVKGGAAVTDATTFEIGSVTKSFDATLLENAVLTPALHVKLADPAYEPLASYHVTGSAEFRKITLGELATHTSGMMDSYLNGGDQVYNDQAPLAAQVDFWNAYPPKDKQTWEPGTCWNYSDVGFVTLAFALAKIYPAPERDHFSTILADVMTKPLGMGCTYAGFGKNPGGCPLAMPYKGVNNSPVTQQASDIKSTPRDMLQYVKAELGVLDLSKDKQLVDAINGTHAVQGTYPYCTTPARKETMGLAWQQTPFESTAGVTLFTKNGAVSGFQSIMYFVPARQIGIVMLVNQSDSTPPDGTALQTLQALSPAK